MAGWVAPLPSEAAADRDTHLEDHNSILACIVELRDRVEALEKVNAPVRKTAAKRKAASGE